MKKTLRLKYTQIFNDDSFQGKVKRLESLIQFLSKPQTVLFTDMLFFRNLLNEYLARIDHGNHKFIFVLQAILALQIAKYKDSNTEDCLTDFNKAYLRIAFVGLLDHEYLGAALSCIGNFIDDESIVKNVYKIFSLRREKCHGLQDTTSYVKEFMSRLYKHLRAIKNWSAKNGVTKPIRRAYRRCNQAVIEHVSADSDVSLQVMINSKNAPSLDDLVLSWKRLFDISVGVNVSVLYENSDKLALVLLGAIVRREGGLNRVNEEITLSCMLNKVGHQDYNNYQPFILKTLRIILIQLGHVNKNTMIDVINKVLTLMFSGGADTETCNRCLDVLKVLTHSANKDSESIDEIYCSFIKFIENNSFINQKLLARNMGLLCKYMYFENLTVVLNTMLKVLIEKKLFLSVANVMGNLPVIRSEVSDLALRVISQNIDLKKDGVENPEVYIYAYVKSVSRRSSIDEKFLNDLMDIVCSALEEKNYHNRGGVFVLFANLLRSYSKHKSFKKIELKEAFLDFCQREDIKGKYVQFFMQLFVDVGVNIIEDLDLEKHDLVLLLSCFSEYLYSTTNRGAIEKLCVTFEKILDEEDNMVCRYSEVKANFLENLMAVIEEKKRDYLLPVIKLLLERSSQLSLGATHSKRIRIKLMSLLSSTKTTKKTIYFDCLVLSVKNIPGEFQDKRILPILCKALIQLNSIESLAALEKIVSFLDIDKLNSIFCAMPTSFKKKMDFLFKEVIPKFEEQFSDNDSSKNGFSRIFGRTGNAKSN